MTVCRFLAICVLSLWAAACDKPDQSSGTASSEGVSAATDPMPECTLVMGWDPWEPYQYQIDGVHVFGLDVDLLTAVVHSAGCSLDFKQGNWTELLAMLKSGEVDVLAGATRTAEREEFAHFTNAYRDEEFLVYVRADRNDELTSLSVKDMAERGMTIGVIDGYLYGDTVSAYQDDPDLAAQFVYSPMSEISFSMLLDAEVDAIIEDKYVGASIIRRKDLSKFITLHPQGFDKSDVHFMLSRASVDDALFQRIDQSLAGLLETGQIQIILAQYQNQ